MKRKSSFKNAISFPAKFMFYFYVLFLFFISMNEPAKNIPQKTHTKPCTTTTAGSCLPVWLSCPGRNLPLSPRSREAAGCPANGFYPRDASVNDVFQNLRVDFTMRKNRLECHYNTIPNHSQYNTAIRRH